MKGTSHDHRVSIRELAALLRVSTDTLRRAYRRGDLPAIRVKTALRFDLEEVHRVMQRQAETYRSARRCGKAWWPRQLRKPVRPPGCKSPYWDKPPRVQRSRRSLNQSVHKDALATTFGETLTKAVGSEKADHQGDHSDRSLAHALNVLKEMKAAGRTWQEMADRLEREFGTKLEKDQVRLAHISIPTICDGPYGLPWRRLGSWTVISMTSGTPSRRGWSNPGSICTRCSDCSGTSLRS